MATLPPISAFPIPVALATKEALGLGNVDNTSDLLKPISQAVQAALDQKRSTLTAIALADLAGEGATTGQVLKWNGTTWAPGTDLVGGGGGGGGAVNTVFGRTGDVTPQSNDYTFAQIGSKPTTLSGYGITDAAPSSHVASGGSAHAVATTGAAGFMSSTDKTKLDGIANAATANQSDTFLLNRDNHQGAQAISTVTGLQGALDAKAPINNPTFTGTVGGITKGMVGLGAVDNTADASKPVSTAQAAAIAARHVNIQFQNAGSNLGATGTADTFNATGALTLARATNVLTLSVADAASGAKGVIQLAGALGGSAASPTALGYSSAAAFASAFDAKAPLTPGVENVATGAPYTIVVADEGKVKRLVDASPQTVNLTTAMSGKAFTLRKISSAGTVTIDVNAGCNVNGAGDGVNLPAWTGAGLITFIPTGANTWDALGSGDLTVADISGLGANVATLLTTFSSANLAAALTDETGTGSAVFATGATMVGTIRQLQALPGTDDTYQGDVITGRNAGATLAQWDAVYLDSSGTWQLADANGTNTYPARGLVVAGTASAAAAIVLEDGVARNDAWAWTVGGDIYLSTTAGGLTQTAPSGSGDKVQKVGYALTADSMRVKIGSGEYLTVA